MSTKSTAHKLELTRVETTLRQLLLDVASFIDNTAVPEVLDSDVTVPQELSKAKLELRWTGGWVRDKLLGVRSHDIDVAINKMTGYQFGLKMQEYLQIPGNPEKYDLDPVEPSKEENKGDEKASNRIAKGLHKIEANPEKSKHLETVTTKILGLDIDLVNLRKETYTEDSRNPQMEFGTPEEDALRRDATVNAMFYNLSTSEIEDFTGRGFDDMEAKIIRTPLEPYQTFKDDPLRVLRLIRFASRLNYKIDPDTERAMENDEIKAALKLKISRERVGIELEKMLKGPDPVMALELIDRLGLYTTIFTDPTREIDYEPDVGYLSKAYRFVSEWVKPDMSPDLESSPLTRTSEEKYLAWICAAMIPWADAPLPPPPKPGKQPPYIAYLVAREGIKAPNKICDVIALCLKHGEEIRRLKDQCYAQVKYPHRKQTGEDATARDTLGMAIRRWGPSWRTQLLFSYLYESCTSNASKTTIVEPYKVFMHQLSELDVEEAYTYKPIITGIELAKALSTRPGPWMKDALDVVMAWQLRHPDVTDPAAALEAVRAHQEANGEGETKSDQKTSELSSRLATHFLQLTIRPLFSASQNRIHPDITAAGYKATMSKSKKWKDISEEGNEPWKDHKQNHGIELLRWVLLVLDAKGVEANWGVLVPPILRMLDDISTTWKAKGCEMLMLLLKSTPPPLLERTGLGKLFEETLFPLFSYLPTLTPEKESRELIDKTIPAIMALGNVMHPPPSNPPSTSTQPSSSPYTPPKSKSKNTSNAPLSTDPNRPREKFLDALLRRGILAPLAHASPSTYPALSTTILSHLPRIIESMGIDSVKHLQSLIPILSDILSEPLGPAYPPLMEGSAKGLQSLMLNAWPRMGRWRGEVLKGVSIGWLRCGEEEEGKLKKGGDEGRLGELGRVKEELKTVVGMLEAVMGTDEGVDWEGEKRVLLEADGRLEGLFD